MHVQALVARDPLNVSMKQLSVGLSGRLKSIWTW
jgi:hypothetical protein